MADILDLATAALSRSAMNVANQTINTLTGTAIGAVNGLISADPLGCGSCPPITGGGRLTGLNDPCGIMNTSMNNATTSIGLSGANASIGALAGIGLSSAGSALGMSDSSDSGAGCCLLRLFDDFNPIPEGGTISEEILGFQNEFDSKRDVCAVLVIKDGDSYYVYGYSDSGEWNSATPTTSASLIKELSKPQRERNRNAITMYAITEIDRTAPTCLVTAAGTNGLTGNLVGNVTSGFNASDAGSWFNAASEEIKSLI